MLKFGLIFSYATIAFHVASGSVLPVPESSISPGFSPEQMNQLSGICFTAIRLMLDQTLTQQGIKSYEAIQQEEKVTPRKVIPPEFEQIGSRFFYIAWFPTAELLNWFAAERTCRQMGAQLATIQNEEELKAIKEKVGKTIESYWLDLNDLVTKGEFVSWSSGKVAPFYNWFYPQPENKDNDENCVSLFSNGAMFRDPCLRKQLYICQALED